MKASFIANMTLQFDNPVSSPQFGAPVLVTTISICTNEQGQQMYQPAYNVTPATPDDITDEVLQAIQVKLSSLGLTVSRNA